MYRTSFIASLLLVILTLTTGCPSPPDIRPTTYYAGPTLPLAAVVDEVNANNEKLPTLWSRHTFQAWIVDERQKETYVDGDGELQYRAGGDFRLNCKKVGLGEIMTLGTNGDTYWLTVRPEVDTMWWGRMRFVGSPCSQQVPLDPTLIAQVLGVGRIDSNFLNLPAPVLRFNNDQDVYMVTWNVRQPTQWAAQREVWYDRKSLLPVRVMLYGEHGRVLLRADLANHEPVTTQRNADTGAKVATVYTLSFPDTGSRMILRLRDPLLSRNGFPKDAAFVLPLNKPGVAKVIQVDEACGP
jgi:hypothetical protein